MAVAEVKPDIFVRRSGILKIFTLLKEKESSASSSNDELMSELEHTSRLLSVAGDLFSDDETRTAIRKKLEEDMQRGSRVTFIEIFKLILSEWVLADGPTATLETLTTSLISNGLPRLAEMIERALLPSSMASSVERKQSLKRRRSSKLSNPAKEDPVAKALSNGVVLGEIFKNLSFKDQKRFRLVNKTWYWETLKYNWRRSVWLNIRAGRARADPGSKAMGWMTFKDFHRQFSKNEKDAYHLLEFPYRCYSFGAGDAIRRPLRTDLHEVAFWNSMGPQMTSLDLSLRTVSKKLRGINLSTILWLLLEACPNLEQLIISAYENKTQEKFDELRKKGEEQERKSSDKRMMTVATKLKYLDLEICPPDVDTKELFKLLPNLKVFRGVHNQNCFDGIQHPLSNGDFIKLERLELGDMDFDSHFSEVYHLFDFHSLNAYSSAFSPSTITHLELGNVDVFSARSRPFELYSALHNFRSSLKTLKLTFSNHIIRLDRKKKWFLDISFIEFPKLTNFHLRFNANEEEDDALFLFDFAALKGMKNLEELSLRYFHNAYQFGRRMDTGDWMYSTLDHEHEQRMRNRFVPKELRQQATYPHLRDALHLQHLRKLKFQGFPLDLEDISYFQEWFPNVNHLEAAFDRRRSVIGALQTWEGLKTLRLIVRQENNGVDLTSEQLEGVRRDFPRINIDFADNNAHGDDDEEYGDDDEDDDDDDSEEYGDDDEDDDYDDSDEEDN